MLFRTEYPQPQLIDPPSAPVEKKQSKTYPQDWPNYNRAQTQEKDLFMQLLAGLCETIDEAQLKRPGRPRIPLADTAFLACYKVYEGASARRFMSDARAAMRAGHTSCAPHFNSVLNALNDPRMTEVLLNFITITSLPFTGYENTFAADSSGFTSSKYDRWLDLKSSKLREEHTWTKVHVMAGVKSHVVTAVTIKGKNASDTKELPELLRQTTENFAVKTVCADKAYASTSNYDLMASNDIGLFIPFKSNHTGKGKGRSGKDEYKQGKELWAKMFHLFQFHREEFLSSYHQRSNVETVFSMVKAKFGGVVRSKTEIAALNEVLCKLVCHNICCLISAMFELDFDLSHLFPVKPASANFLADRDGVPPPMGGSA